MGVKIDTDKIILSKEYTTHMMVLIKVAQLSQGPILELGGGLFSTPLLHWLCSETKRPLVTYEDSPIFAPFLKRFVSRYHSIRIVDNWNQVNITGHWGMAFIDLATYDNPKNSTQKRNEFALALRDKVDYIVIHDSNEKPYRDGEFWKNFKYVYHWTYATPNTTIVSDLKEIPFQE